MDVYLRNFAVEAQEQLLLSDDASAKDCFELDMNVVLANVSG